MDFERVVASLDSLDLKKHSFNGCVSLDANSRLTRSKITHLSLGTSLGHQRLSHA